MESDDYWADMTTLPVSTNLDELVSAWMSQCSLHGMSPSRWLLAVCWWRMDRSGWHHVHAWVSLLSSGALRVIS